MKMDNLTIYTLVNSIGGLLMGILGPFYVIYIQKIGGTMESFGVAFGLMMIAQSLSSYFIGKYSDKFGRKPFLILCGYAYSLVLFLYTLIQTVLQLYVLQIIMGFIDAIEVTISTAFLGDMTTRNKRGLQIGKYNTLVGLSTGLSMMIGGLLVGVFGFELIFYFCSLSSFILTSFLFLLKETRRHR